MPKSLGIGIILIILLGVALRLPNVAWLSDALWENHYSLTGVENKHINTAINFANKEKNYTVGIPAHIYVVKEILKRVSDKRLDRSDYVLIARTISLFYGVMTIGLVAIVSWSLSSSIMIALISALFFATAPLTILYSDLGTSDSAVNFFFLLATFLAYLNCKNSSDILFTLCMAAVGVCLAMKFFVSVFTIPLFVLVSGNKKLSRLIIAVFVIVGSFATASFFNFTPWDFLRFAKLLRYDNIQIIQANSTIENLFAYLHKLFSTVGLGCGIFFVCGLWVSLFKLLKTGKKLKSSKFKITISDLIIVAKHPITIFIIPFTVQLFLVLNLGINPARHILFLVPIVCYISAIGMSEIIRKMRSQPLIRNMIVLLVFAYQLYNVHGLSSLYKNDIRLELKNWVADNVEPDEIIGSFSYYSGVSGIIKINNQNIGLLHLQPDYIATCSHEYFRYLSESDPGRVYHLHGGKERFQFFNELFNHKSSYRQVAQFNRKNYSIEQTLISMNILGDIDIRVPNTCIVFRKEDTKSY